MPFGLFQAVGRAASAPVIDGRLDEECWKRAVLLTDLTDSGGDGRVKDQAELRICYDDEMFYFGFFQRMSDMGELQIRHRSDESNIWNDSYFEMQFDVAGEHQTVYPQILINAEGYVFHRKMTPGIQVKSRIVENGYRIEGSIPFADLYPSSKLERQPPRPRPGERWGFNLCGQASATAEFFCWSNTHGLFRKPAMLGDIVFLDAAATVSIPPPAPFHGRQKIEMTLTNNAAEKRSLVLTAQVRPALRKHHDYFIRKIRGDDVAKLEPAGESEVFQRKISLQPGETRTTPLRYEVSHPGANDLTLSVGESEHGDVLYRASYNIPPEIELYPVYNPYHERVRILVNAYVPKPPSGSIEVTLADAKGVTRAFETAFTGKSREAVFQIDTSDLPAGRTQITARMGRRASSPAFFTIPDRPEKPGRIGLTEEQFLTWDGDPRLVLSLMTRDQAKITPELLKEMAAAGFTSVQPYWTALTIDRYPAERLYQQIADEPSGYMNTTGEELLPQYLKLRGGTTDPAYVILDNFVGVRKVRSWAFACDVVSSDPYPWPSSSLYQVGDWVERCRTAVLGAKPVFVTLQAFDNAFDGTGMPTPEVLRAMSYIAVIHRANGIQYFIYEHQGLHALQEDPKLWSALKEMVKELSSLNDVFVAPGVAQDFKVISERRVDWLLKRHAGKTYLFTVNGNASPAAARFSPVGLPQGKKVTVLFENRIIEFDPDGWGDSFKPYERHVYQIE
ncbi:MAG: hypothetical protein HYU36_05895 [Planctomycetes bacterium]|nr:hypothetical protein [Planctomycetota bacterium]